MPQLTRLEARRWSAILASAVIFVACCAAAWACLGLEDSRFVKIALGCAIVLPPIPAAIF